MKSILLFLSLLLFTGFAFSQTPQGLSYQAVAFNSSGNPVVNGNVGVQISILDNSIAGAVVYLETHVKTTNAQGLFNLIIGQGTPANVDFSTINWGSNTKFLKVEVDPNGGTNYTITGTNQLMSVPYALYAEKVNTSGGSLNEDIMESKFANFAFEDSGSGNVYAFNTITASWVAQSGFTSSNGIVGSNGNFAFEDSGSGNVFAFNKTTGTWIAQNGFASSDGIVGSNGNFAFEDSGSGNVYAFHSRTGVWVAQSGFASSDGIVGSSGNFAFEDSGSGNVYAFNQTTGTWVAQSGFASGDGIVESNGSFAFEDSGSSSVYVFNKNTGTWIGQSGFTSSNGITVSGTN